MVFLDTDFILRVKTMIVLQPYSVLSTLYYKALRMTLLIGVCFLQPNIMMFTVQGLTQTIFNANQRNFM